MSGLSSLQDFQTLQSTDLTDDLRVLLLPAANVGPLEKASLSLADFRQLILGNAIPQTYISGFRLDYNDGETILIGGGECYIPSEGNLVQSSTQIAVPFSTTIQGHYHAFVYLDEGVVKAEILPASGIAATPYLGGARTKLNDVSRRYVGTFTTDASGAIILFDHVRDDTILYRLPDRTIFQVVNDTNATPTITPVSVDVAAPLTTRMVYCKLETNDASFTHLFKGDTTSANAFSSDVIASAGAGNDGITNGVVRTSGGNGQTVTIAYNTTTSGSTVGAWVTGFVFDR